MSNISEEKRKRAIKYLTEHTTQRKQDYQFTVKECAELVHLNERQAYDFMDRLVKEGSWETGFAIDPLTNRRARVWWMKQSEEEASI